MTTDNKYNGWTNYATWRVNLEMLDGLDLSDLFYNEGTDTENAYDIGQELKAYVEGGLELEASGLALDYALAFIDDVNWTEIAANKLEEEN